MSDFRDVPSHNEATCRNRATLPAVSIAFLKTQKIGHIIGAESGTDCESRRSGAIKVCWRWEEISLFVAGRNHEKRLTCLLWWEMQMSRVISNQGNKFWKKNCDSVIVGRFLTFTLVNLRFTSSAQGAAFI